MLSNLKAFIFDMDGTLIDSTWVWDKVDNDYFSSKNIEMPKDFRDNLEHLSFNDAVKFFKEYLNLPDSLEQISYELTNMALVEYRSNVRLKPGAKEFLSSLKKKGYKLGLATSNSVELLELALNGNDIYHYFDVICRTDEVSRGKNYPDIYLYTAKKLGVAPSECAVFEDILPAVKSAKSAGMKVVAVQDDFSCSVEDKIKEVADYYINHYDDLKELMA